MTRIVHVTLPSTTAATTTSSPPDDSKNATARSTEGRNGAASPAEASLSVNSGASAAPEPSCSAKTTQDNKAAKKTYDTWDHEEKQLLLELWMKNYETLERKGSSKSTWRAISDTLCWRLGSSKDSTKCMKKMKYLIERYRDAKDESAKRSDGSARKSEFYDEIDSVIGSVQHIVTELERDVGGGEQKPSPPPPPPRLVDQPHHLPQGLQECSQQEPYTVHLPRDVVRHVTEIVVDPSKAEEPEPLAPVAGHVVQRALGTLGLASTRERSTGNEVGVSREKRGAPNQNARTERKKSGKKRKAEEDEDEDARTLKTTLERFHEQGDRIVQCMETLSHMQSQQVQMMNQFMAVMMQFMQSEQNDGRQAEK